MKKRNVLIRLFALGVFACALVALAGSTPTSAGRTQQGPQTAQPQVKVALNNLMLVPDDPEAVYQGARIVHNVTVDGEKGMRVHANFQVKYGLDVPCMMIAYFYFDDDKGTPLKTDDANYRSKNGVVSAHTNFTPAYDPAVYKDLQIFMPYEALNMESGDDYDLKFYLALYDKEGGRFFGKSGWYKFHLTMP
ncbi:MAG: hypothetical protein ACMG6H_12570 [Acidobacteriota bacterium]